MKTIAIAAAAALLLSLAACDPGPCNLCGGTGQADCTMCQNGRRPCPECTEGKLSTGLDCRECKGKGAIACDLCEGKGTRQCWKCSGKP